MNVIRHDDEGIKREKRGCRLQAQPSAPHKRATRAEIHLPARDFTEQRGLLKGADGHKIHGILRVIVFTAMGVLKIGQLWRERHAFRFLHKG